jgi:hypothetical protein
MLKLSLLILETLRLLTDEGTTLTSKTIISSIEIRMLSLFIGSIFVLVAKIEMKWNDFSFSSVLCKVNKAGKLEKTKQDVGKLNNSSDSVYFQLFNTLFTLNEKNTSYVLLKKMKISFLLGPTCFTSDVIKIWFKVGNYTSA